MVLDGLDAGLVVAADLLAGFVAVFFADLDAGLALAAAVLAFVVPVVAA